MTTLAIKRLSSGGVITNYSCMSRCGHCLYNCGPRRSKDYLDEETAERIFRRIADLGCRAVHIGGGEPLIDPEKLFPVLNAARKTGVGIDYVETNSGWFTDANQADALLNRLREAGVHTLLVSISPFHNAYIPYSRVQGVIDACRRTGMNIFPWVNAFVRDLTRLDQSRAHAMEEFAAVFGSDYLERIPNQYWIHLGGRALETFRPVYPLQPVEEIVKNSPLSCARALADTSHFHIDLYGSYVPGLCSGLAIDMEDLGGPLPPGKYPHLDCLTTTGIRGLLDWAKATHGYQPQKEAYVNHCDLCTDIRLFLLQANGNAFPELSPREFYLIEK